MLCAFVFPPLAHLDFTVGTRLGLHQYPVMYFEIIFCQWLSDLPGLLAEARERSHVRYPTKSHISMKKKWVTTQHTCELRANLPPQHKDVADLCSKRQAY